MVDNSKKEWVDTYGAKYFKKYDNEFFQLCCEGKSPPEAAFEMNLTLEKFETWRTDGKHQSFTRAYEAGMIALESVMIQNLRRYREQNKASAVKAQLEELKRWFPEWNITEKREQTNKDPLKAATNEEIKNKALNALNAMLEHVEKSKPPELKVIDGNKS